MCPISASRKMKLRNPCLPYSMETGGGVGGRRRLEALNYFAPRKQRRWPPHLSPIRIHAN